MRVHFSAALPCVLRLGGAAAGMCGEGEKFADLPDGEPMLIELIPADGNHFPLSFLWNGDFLADPPQGIEVYLYDCGADVRAVHFTPRDLSVRIRGQTRAAGLLLTVFDCGGTRLCAEGAHFFTCELPSANIELGEERIGGQRFARTLCRGGRIDRLLLLSAEGETAFDGDADAYSCGAFLHVRARLFDLLGHTLERTFRAQGGRLLETERALHPREDLPAPLDERLLPFAFFETIAAGGDARPFLTPTLAEQSEKLRGYLGDFIAVRPPKEIFYRTHGPVNAAGLVYRRKDNAFDVRFFCIDLEGGKISNVRPVE